MPFEKNADSTIRSRRNIRTPANENEARLIRNEIADLVRSDPSKAEDLASDFVDQVVRSGSDPIICSIAWRSRAEAALYRGNPTAADEAYSRAVDLATEAKRPDLADQVSVGWVHVQGLLGREEQASRLAAGLHRRLKKRGDSEYLAKLQMNRGNLAYHAGEFRAAGRLYAEAAQAFRSAGIQDSTLIALEVNRAIVLTNLNRFEEAIEVLIGAEELARAGRLEYLVAHSRFNRVHIERIVGRYHEALDGLRESGELFHSQGAGDLVASADRARAELLLELGMPAEAARIGLRAVRQFEAQKMPLDALLAREVAARGFRESSEPQKAIELLSADFDGSSASNYRRMGIELERGELLLMSGDVEAANAVVQSISSRKPRDPGLRARLGLLGLRTSMAGGRESRTREVAERLIGESRSWSRSSGIELRVLCSELDLQRGDLRRARQGLTRAARLVEEHRALAPNALLRSRSFDRHLAVYLQLLRTELSEVEPSTPRLLTWMERARSRGFRDRFHERGRAANNKRLERMLHELRRVHFDLEQTHDSEEPQETERLAIQAKNLEAKILEARMGESERQGVPMAPAETTRIARSLGRNEVCIAFFILDDHVHALCIREGRVRHSRLPTTWKEIRRELDRCRFYLEDADQATPSDSDTDVSLLKVRDSLRRLYDGLVAPVVNSFDGVERLVLAPHRELHGVPFECMFDGVAEMEGVVVSRVPNLSSLVARKRRVPSLSPYSLFAASPKGLRVSDEVRTLKRIFGSQARRVEAKSTQLLSAFAEAGSVHFSTHAEFRSDNPEFSRLQTLDGSLFVGDISKMDVLSPMVFLSACETGVVRPGPQDELDGVAYSLLAAGARRIVASRWRVEDEATTHFVRSFYRALKKSRRPDPALALHEAMHVGRAARPHPFFWGGFSVFES